MSHLWGFNRVKCLFGCLLWVIQPVSANNVFQADQYFSQQKYSLAKAEYSKAAEMGNPHAYYQLGTIYYKGLAGQADPLKALIWFSLAAEQKFNDSERVSSELLHQMPTEQQAALNEIIDSVKQKHGVQHFKETYLPILDTAKLKHKISFEGVNGLDQNYQTTDSYFASLDSATSFSEDTSSFDFGLGEDEFSSGSATSQPNSNDEDTTDFFNRPYLLIVDYDVAADGSIRNMDPIQTIGRISPAMYDLSMHTLPKPSIEGQPTNFINRSYLGLAAYNKFEIRDKNESFYSRIRRLAKRLQKSDLPNDKYQYAMLLQHFSWLTQEPNEAEEALKYAANMGHSKAQYEYGLKFYREQKDIEQAIYWIAEACKRGETRAEYRLGKILADSPWVVNDEKKALFWFEMAAKKDHIAALKKSAELKLNAKDLSLFDLDGALVYLNKIPEKQREDPEYHYLLAMVNMKMQPRKLSVAVEHIREAIDLGDDLNWDVSAWESELASWTSGGRVTIQEP